MNDEQFSKPCKAIALQGFEIYIASALYTNTTLEV